MKFFILMAISYLNMHSQITVGDAVFNNVHSFTIDQSVKELSDKATIILPRNYLKLKNSPVLNYIHAGAPVTIGFGYNDDFETEFTGFVRPGIDADFPLRIECDQLYPLRQNSHALSYQSVTLKHLLNDVVKGYKIECPDVNLGKIRIRKGTSTMEVLRYIRETFGLSAKVFPDNVLRMWWPYDFVQGFTKTYDYTIGLNVRSVKNLKFLQEVDFNTQVTINILQRNGKKRQVFFGDKEESLNAKPIQLHRYDITDAEALQLAKSINQRINYDGYFGSLQGFGIPRTKAGDSIRIINDYMPEREGTYVTERVLIEYAEAHIYRNNFLSFKAA